MFKILFPYARYLGLGVVVLLVFWLTKSHYQARVIEEQNACFAKEAEAQVVHNAALKSALIEQQKWQQRAQEASVKLAQMQEELDQQAKALKGQVSYVIQKDSVYSGLGADSVHLYNRALGYTENAPE